jgi:hypothetical protein
VATAHIVVLSAAFLTLLVLPCVVTAALRAGRDEPCDDTVQAALRYYRSPRGRAETRALRVLDEAMCDDATVPLPVGAVGAVGAVGPTIEQIACDLRRLGQQRLARPAAESVIDAYDQCLTLACRCLEISEHLRPLDGIDRDLERVRVEGALQAAGFHL